MHPYRDSSDGFSQADLAWFRKPLGALILLLVGCARLAHVDPQPRDEWDKSEAAVFVSSYCDWTGEGFVGSGVVISEHHVLTAQHLVECPDLPRVYITLHNGNRHRAYVTDENRIQDIAKLEIAHAGSFGLNIAPPMLAPVWDHPVTPDYLCAYTPRKQPVCDVRLDDDLFAVALHKGTSGSGVYDRGYLVGIVIRSVAAEPGGLPYATRMAIVTPDWLKGT